MPSLHKGAQIHDLLDQIAQPACFGALGGFRPADKHDRFTSWWGGNFLGREDEDVPVCRASRRAMAPVFQVRVDELPFVPSGLSDVALLTLWLDEETEHFAEAPSGVGFTIRTYSSLDGLKPLGPGYREHSTLPTFPISWCGFEQDLPCWEEFQDIVPKGLSRSDSDDVFHNHPAFAARDKIQSERPIKVGGYSEWWQSPQHVEGGKYVFFLDSTEKGLLGIGPGGNANFFRTPDTWEMRSDWT